jgi:hypothetical protein
MTTLTVALAIGFVGVVALYADERLNRKTAQRSAEYWRAVALRVEEQEDAPQRVPFDEL